MAKDDLTGIEWLATAHKRERQISAATPTWSTFPAGTVLFHEGDAPRWFYAVVKAALWCRSMATWSTIGSSRSTRSTSCGTAGAGDCRRQ